MFWELASQSAVLFWEALGCLVRHGWRKWVIRGRPFKFYMLLVLTCFPRLLPCTQSWEDTQHLLLFCATDQGDRTPMPFTLWWTKTFPPALRRQRVWSRPGIQSELQDRVMWRDPVWNNKKKEKGEEEEKKGGVTGTEWRKEVRGSSDKRATTLHTWQTKGTQTSGIHVSIL